jgi:hypothetical protein
MQMRDIRIRVNDKPKLMDPTPSQYHHSIAIPPSGSQEEKLVITLSLVDVTSYFPVQKPLLEDFESSETIMNIELTAESPTWDPNADRFRKQEDLMLDHNMQLTNEVNISRSKDRNVLSIHTCDPDTTNDLLCGNAMQLHVRVTLGTNCSVSVVKSDGKLPYVSATTISKQWNIGFRTLVGTTQKEIISLQHPML